MSGQATEPIPTTEQLPTEITRRKRSRAGLYTAVAVIVIAAVALGAAWGAGWLKPASTAASNCAGPGAGPSVVATPAVTATANRLSPSTTTPTILGAGSSLVYPLMYQWESVYSAATVNYLSVGSSAGITDITQKSVDFGASDAPLNGAQRGAAPGVLTIPESAGAVVPIYNLPGVGVLKFNGTVLAEIYLGKLTNWNNTPLQTLNPAASLPNACIQVVHRSDGSGTTFIWTSYLSLENKTWSTQVGKGTTVNWPVGTGQAKNAGVAGYVGKTPDSIGYVDLNYALNTGGVTMGAVKNPAGNYISATVANSASALTDANPTLPSGGGDWYNVSLLNAPGANDYPITSLTYMFVYQNLSKAYPSYTLTNAEALVAFLNWTVTTGQSYSALLYYVPLPAYIVTADQTTIASMTFNGSPVP